MKGSDLISDELRAALTQKRPSTLYTCLAFDYLLCIFVMVGCEWFWHPVSYILAVMLIGARQIGIGSIALHDGAHYLLSEDRNLNDQLAKFIGASVFAPIYLDFKRYRKNHYTHHQTVNSEQDPEVQLTNRLYQLPRWKVAMFLLLPLTGFLFVVFLLNFLIRKWRAEKRTALAVASFILLLIIGLALDIYAAQLFLYYWVIPLATWGMHVNAIRASSEHYPEQAFDRETVVPSLFHTRDILSSWFDLCFVTTRGVNFHLSHHLLPSVPFYNLAKLQAALTKSNVYREYAHVTLGYHRFLLELFFQRAKS